MAKIEIEWLHDTRECETCGTSWAQGAEVFKDGIPWFLCKPIARCFDSDNWSGEDIYIKIIAKLGHEVEEIAQES